MNTSSRLTSITLRLARLLLLGSLLLTGGGCSFFHNFGSGTHLDAPPDKPTHPGTAKAATMQIEVTTDAVGQVTTVTFVRGSGSNAVDGFVADSIRHNWPGGPSTRSLVEMRYEPSSGFSQPKLLSSTPAP